MKKIIFTMLGMLMITGASAEDNEYFPLVRDGVTWYYLRYEGSLNELLPISSYYLYSYNCDGDTVVVDKGEMKTYKKVVYKEYDNSQNVTYSAVLRCIREEDKVVYAKDLFENIYDLPEDILYKPLLLYPYWAGWDDENSQFYTEYNNYEGPIYDFNRESFLPDDHGLGLGRRFRRQCSATNVTINGESHKAYSLSDSIGYYTAAVIEGIGIDSRAGHLLGPQYPLAASFYQTLDGLAWVEENGSIIYKGVMYDSAQSIITDISNINGDKQVAGVRYYNIAGVESTEPQQGVNIRVTTYTDGSSHTDKIIR